MPVTSLLLEGVELMLLGMGSVFVFLAALVIVLKGMSRLAQALAPEEIAAGVASKADEDVELLAVISAAIARYRSRHK
ncbi:MAG: OadG family protein [Gammaproteobacteria bacterium]|nr:OadG family protein [Gammaproteobacteria bacterium]